MRPQKLIWQMYPATVIVMLVAVVAITWYGAIVFREFFLQESELDLEARASLIRSRVQDYIDAGNIAGLRAFCKEAGRESGTRITIIAHDGVVLADSNENPESMENHHERPEILAAYRGEQGRILRYSKTLEQKMLYIARPLNSQARLVAAGSGVRPDVQTVLRMSVPFTSLDETMQRLRLRVMLGCVVITVGAALLTLFLVRNISRPLEEMTRTAERFAKGDFRQRMTPYMDRTSSYEVTALASSMDQMAEMLDEKIKTIVTHRNQLETVFSSMVEAVIAIDSQERVISINTAAAELLGINRQTALGKVVPEIIRNSHLQEQVQHILTTMASVEDEIVLKEPGGDRYLQTNVVTLNDGKDESVGVLVVMNDVTKLRKLERIRSDFVGNVSHELRTPITSIQGYVETLLDGALDEREDAVRFLEIVLRQSQRLNAIIDDLLALSRIEQESSEGAIHMEEGLVRRVLEAALQTSQVKADQHGVLLELNCQNALVATMNETLLEQAVVNLLVNAIKYSKEGDSVLVWAAVVADDDSGSWVQIGVKDSGCGISPEHLPRLFERFYRSDKARSRELGGTGLGLAIVKHIAGAHRGRIDVESQLGEGSEFILTIPGRIC
ncbi:MAG: ATP-binding protein [Desulfopila sp.]